MPDVSTRYRRCDDSQRRQHGALAYGAGLLRFNQRRAVMWDRVDEPFYSPMVLSAVIEILDRARLDIAEHVAIGGEEP